jgi:hypothetical protein
MRFMVEVDAGMEKANAVDGAGGPGPMLAKLAERFKPEAVYGKASRRGAYMVVDLKSPADISELMYALTWGTGGEPKFTPILTESFDEIIWQGQVARFTASLNSFFGREGVRPGIRARNRGRKWQ